MEKQQENPESQIQVNVYELLGIKDVEIAAMRRQIATLTDRNQALEKMIEQLKKGK